MHFDIPKATEHFFLVQTKLIFLSTVYTRAVESASSEKDKSHLLAAVAMCLYKLKDMEAAKTALFQRLDTNSSPLFLGALIFILLHTIC